MSAIAHRIRRLRAAMDVPAILATDPANVRFLTGLAAMGDVVYRDTPLWVLVGVGGHRVIAPASEVPSLGLDPGEVIAHGEVVGAGEAVPGGGAASPVEAVALAARELEIGDVLGVDAAVHGPVLRELERIFPRAAITEHSLRAARRIKDPDELDALRAANRIVEDALLDAVAGAGAGITERELAVRVQTGILERGGQPTLHVVAFGERSALFEPWPGDTPLRRGDVVRFDLGATVDGYHSDLARTAVCGPPDPWVAETHAAILAGETAALQRAASGVTAADVFHAAVDATRAAGLPAYERRHCGHAIGLTVYEDPLIAPGEADVLEAGMTFCLETPYYVLGRAGFHIEDAVVIATQRCERLGAAPRDLLEIAP